MTLLRVRRLFRFFAEIWSDFEQGCLDMSLPRYKPLVEGQEPDLLKALKVLVEQNRQGGATHVYRVLKRYGAGLRTRQVLNWLEHKI